MLPFPPRPFFAGSAPSPLQDFRRTLPLTFPQLNTILPARPPFPTRNCSKEIDYSRTPPHNRHLGDRRKSPVWRGGPYGQLARDNMTIYLGRRTCLLC